ncbi:MAG: hemerythrin family protein [Meiothermus sp.]|nr:hemerythrin family protein [Meiothermus sp.]
MPIEWSERYAVGEARVDRQHQKLFEYINRLERLVEEAQSQPLDQEEVENVFAFLEAYVHTHFAYEELCMALRGCPVAQRNKEAHERFLDFWTDFSRKHSPKTVDPQALERLHTALSGWLTQHICKVDVGLRKAPPPA